MRKETHFDPWLCASCGYLMDTSTSAFAPYTSPKEGDLSFCLNCGAITVLHSGKWIPITPSEMNNLSDKTKDQLRLMENSRKAVHIPDLAKRGGHA